MVGSNFTARVLQGVELKKAAESRSAERKRTSWWARFIPRVALAGLVGGAGIFSWSQFHAAQMRAEARREQAIKGIVTVSKVPTLPSAEILEDFDTVRLSGALIADEKLLTLLQ
jgi:hypothetical protein